MKKEEIICNLKLFGITKKYAIRKPKRNLALIRNNFILFFGGNDVRKGRKFA